MNHKISIVDYGTGNLLSIARALNHFDYSAKFAQNEKDILNAEKLILPGVGAYGKAMHELSNRGLVNALKTFAGLERPMLGVCLGMQMLLSESDEFGKNTGLDIIPGKVIKIPQKKDCQSKIKIPHIGWARIQKPDRIEQKNAGHLLLNKISRADWFYFVHSYVAKPAHSEKIIATCNYGNTSLVAAIAHGNVIGTQFHPEKSSLAGLKIIKNFLDL